MEERAAAQPPVMITIPGAGALNGTGQASTATRIRYAAGRASRSVSS